MKLSTFIIGLLTISLVITIISLFITSMGEQYGKNTDDLNLTVYNKMSELTDNINETKGSVSGISSDDTSLFDIFGKLFFGGWNAAKTAVKSADVAEGMIDSTFENKDLNLGDSGGLLRNYIWGVLAVIFFIGILLSLVLKWNT